MLMWQGKKLAARVARPPVELRPQRSAWRVHNTAYSVLPHGERPSRQLSTAL